MRRISKLLAAILLSGTCSGAAYLRPLTSPERPEPDEGDVLPTSDTFSSRLHRFLQFDSIVMNGLVDLFIPSLSDQVQGQIASQDPVFITWSTSADQGELPLNVNRTFCNATSARAVATYSISRLSGLKTVDVTRVELVGDSANINVPAMALFGAQESTWAGTWQVDSKFDRLIGATGATLGKTFCNFTFEEALNGNTTMEAPTVAMTIRLTGETSDIYSFQQTSQVNSAKIETFDIGFATVSSNLGTWNDWVTLDANSPLITIANNGMTGDLRNLLRDQIQRGIDNRMPYRLNQ